MPGRLDAFKSLFGAARPALAPLRHDLSRVPLLSLGSQKPTLLTNVPRTFASRMPQPPAALRAALRQPVSPQAALRQPLMSDATSHFHNNPFTTGVFSAGLRQASRAGPRPGRGYAEGAGP